MGRTCWGGRLSRNPLSRVVMTAADSMQETYRSWMVEQQGLQTRSLTHDSILNTGKYELHLINETWTTQ